MTIRTKTPEAPATATASEQPKQGGFPTSFLVIGLVASLAMLGNNYLNEQNKTQVAATECQARLESTYVAIDKLRRFTITLAESVADRLHQLCYLRNKSAKDVLHVAVTIENGYLNEVSCLCTSAGHR